MRVLNGCISIILLLSLAMGLYCAGTDKTYDFMAHLESISAVTEEMPMIEEIGYIWYADMVVNEAASAWEDDEYQVVKVIHLREWPYGLFGADRFNNGEEEIPSFMNFDIWFAWDDPNATYWEGWQPIIEFVEGTTSLAARVVFSVIWLGNYVQSFFDLVFAISPTSGIVERGSI